MSDIRFHRTDNQRPLQFPLRTTAPTLALQSGRPVTFRTMCLDITHLRRINPPFASASNHRFLRRPFGAVNPRSAHPDSPPYHESPPAPITVRHRVRQPLQHHHAASFTAHKSVCTRIERFAMPVGASIPNFENAMLFPATKIRFTPAASAIRHSPDSQTLTGQMHRPPTTMNRPYQPIRSAPANPTYEIRPATRLCALPDASYASSANQVCE